MMIDSFFSYFIVGGFMKITVDELLQKLGSIHLIDIRDKESYLEGHIPGAKNIVSSELIYHPNRYLDFDKLLTNENQDVALIMYAPYADGQVSIDILYGENLGENTYTSLMDVSNVVEDD